MSFVNSLLWCFKKSPQKCCICNSTSYLIQRDDALYCEKCFNETIGIIDSIKSLNFEYVSTNAFLLNSFASFSAQEFKLSTDKIVSYILMHIKMCKEFIAATESIRAGRTLAGKLKIDNALLKMIKTPDSEGYGDYLVTIYAYINLYINKQSILQNYESNIDNTRKELYLAFAQRHRHMFFSTEISSTVSLFNLELNKFTKLLQIKYNLDMSAGDLLVILSHLIYVDVYEQYKEYFKDYQSDREIIISEHIRSIPKPLEMVSFLVKYLSEIGYNCSLSELSSILSVRIEAKEAEKFEEKLLQKESTLSMQALDTMSGIEFEKFVADLFKRMGFSVEVTKASGDQGADVLAEKDGMRCCIQAKNYTGVVSNGAVQEVVASLNYYKANKGYIVTNSKLTKHALQLAAANSIEVIDRDRLLELLSNYFN